MWHLLVIATFGVNSANYQIIQLSHALLPCLRFIIMFLDNDCIAKLSHALVELLASLDETEIW